MPPVLLVTTEARTASPVLLLPDTPMLESPELLTETAVPPLVRTPNLALGLEVPMPTFVSAVAVFRAVVEPRTMGFLSVASAFAPLAGAFVRVLAPPSRAPPRRKTTAGFVLSRA